MEIIVGKNGEQKFQITEPTVSGRHARVSARADGRYEVEDLDSTNGTFVDGQRVIRKIVDAETEVFLGQKFSFKVCDILPQEHLEKEMAENFLRLKEIYDTYIESKVRIQKETAKTSFMRILPMSLIGIISLCVGLIPAMEGYRMFVIPIGVLASALLITRAYNKVSDAPMRLAKLDEQFKIDYVCPKCKTFLGFVPFEGLTNKRQCAYCKTKWV